MVIHWRPAIPPNLSGNQVPTPNTPSSTLHERARIIVTGQGQCGTDHGAGRSRPENDGDSLCVGDFDSATDDSYVISGALIKGFGGVTKIQPYGWTVTEAAGDNSWIDDRDAPDLAGRLDRGRHFSVVWRRLNVRLQQGNEPVVAARIAGEPDARNPIRSP